MGPLENQQFFGREDAPDDFELIEAAKAASEIIASEIRREQTRAAKLQDELDAEKPGRTERMLTELWGKEEARAMLKALVDLRMKEADRLLAVQMKLPNAEEADSPEGVVKYLVYGVDNYNVLLEIARSRRNRTQSVMDALENAPTTDASIETATIAANEMSEVADVLGKLRKAFRNLMGPESRWG